MQVEVIDAKFHGGSHSYSFSPNGLDIKKGDYVIVETEKGRDLVKVVSDRHMVSIDSLVEPLKNVVKIAEQKELDEAKKQLPKG